MFPKVFIKRRPMQSRIVNFWIGNRSSSPPLDKALQVTPRSHAQDKLPARIRHNRKLLLPTPIHPSTEELFQLLQRCLGRDDFVPSSASLELVHRCLDRIAVLDFAFFEQLLQARDADVAEQRARFLRGDGEVGVVALKAAHQGP
jgi:hypothetical protein